MYDDIVRAIDASDRKLALDIIERDVEVDRILLTIQRHFNIYLNTMVSNKPSDLPIIDLHFYEHIGIRLERIADHIVRMALMISLLKTKENIVINKYEYADVKKIYEYLNALPNIIFSLDRKKAHEILDIYDLRKKNDFINNSIINKPSINILIKESLERIRSYVSNIAEETINYINIKNVA